MCCNSIENHGGMLSTWENSRFFHQNSLSPFIIVNVAYVILELEIIPSLLLSWNKCGSENAFRFKRLSVYNARGRGKNEMNFATMSHLVFYRHSPALLYLYL
jgi:hypothetical protein